MARKLACQRFDPMPFEEARRRVVVVVFILGILVVLLPVIHCTAVLGRRLISDRPADGNVRCHLLTSAQCSNLHWRLCSQLGLGLDYTRAAAKRQGIFCWGQWVVGGIVFNMRFHSEC